MTTRTYKNGEWTVSVQSERPGEHRKDRWDASAYRGDTRLVTNHWYSTHDDAFNAISDMIHTEMCNEERWRDYFRTLAEGGFAMVMRGEYDLSKVQQRLQQEYLAEQAYQQTGQRFVDNKEINQ